MIEVFGARAMMLQVRVSNQPALHLYEKTIGFTVTKVSKHYYLDGEDALILTHNFTLDTLINKDCSSVVVDEWKRVMQEQENKQKE
ncbi:hypothetical protein CL6EHI_001280 [Entamoeba histolytica]|nr:hypothetical protein EHI_001280 [Entamoeba histolytica HM-1:IMSS]EDS89006.1 hypothetical protein EHI_001280 [Entamoeba histolytica HM-1:IMSS]GAT98924.1 hypothetical protein CL6EHI_001280 [Entamoeba histolytica]|eukprot:XP_001914217.1 hypothetical protein EHI_001280 [Entamoeba histolytica HM-1:IMSS]